MKTLLLAFAIVAGTSVHADPAAQFVEQTMTEAKRILALQEPARSGQMCNLLRAAIGSQTIAQSWLGNYWSLPREQQAVQDFTSMVPSIMMSKALPVLGSGGVNGTFTIDPASKARGNGVYEVTVTINANSNSYTGFAIVQEISGGFQLIDVEYQGFSAVDYQGREYQKFLNREYNKDVNLSMPVTKLIELVTTAEDYYQCP